MMRLPCLRQSHTGLWRSRALFAPAAASIRCAPSRVIPSSPELLSSLQALARRASSKQSPLKQSPLKQSPSKPEVKPKFSPRIVLYHYGMPRVLVLGVLKITAVFILGFFFAVVIPSHAQTDAPTWQVAGLVVASTVPFLAIWYLTSPMVMWIHAVVPKRIPRNPAALAHFFRDAPPATEVVLTTMGAVGKPRLTKVPVKDLRRETRRFGLANYVRDVRRENADRKWYQFRAVGEFRIEDQRPPKSKTDKPWLWYTLAENIGRDEAKGAPRVQPVHARERK